jgi:hypothetical protein
MGIGTYEPQDNCHVCILYKQHTGIGIIMMCLIKNGWPGNLYYILLYAMTVCGVVDSNDIHE